MPAVSSCGTPQMRLTAYDLVGNEETAVIGAEEEASTAE